MLLFICSGIAFGDSIQGVVINVPDGDTIIVLEKTPQEKIAHRVRLKEIDAPEGRQEGGEDAACFLKKLIWGETVTVQYTERDQYGRILGLVYYKDSLINHEMVKEGWAWHYKYSTSSKLALLEAKARKDKKGLWAEPNPVPPWEWRARKRNEEGFRKGNKRDFLLNRVDEKNASS